MRWQGQFAVGSRVRGTLYSWASRLHTRASAAAVYIQARTRPPAAAVPAAGDRAVLSRPREREPLPKLMFPKADIAAFQHPKRSTSTPPQTILLIGSSAHGMMRAAAGGPAVPSRSRPAQAGEEARGCVCLMILVTCDFSHFLLIDFTTNFLILMTLQEISFQVS